MLDIMTDLTRLTRHEAKLPSNWDYTTDLQEGEWVSLNNDNTIARITGTHNTPNAFPVWTGGLRADVAGAEKVTLIVSPFMAKTDIYTAGSGGTAVAHNVSLTVTGSSDNPGRLARASSSDLIVAHCMVLDSANGEITFRFVDGYAFQS